MNLIMVKIKLTFLVQELFSFRRVCVCIESYLTSNWNWNWIYLRFAMVNRQSHSAYIVRFSFHWKWTDTSNWISLPIEQICWKRTNKTADDHQTAGRLGMWVNSIDLFGLMGVWLKEMVYKTLSSHSFSEFRIAGRFVSSERKQNHKEIGEKKSKQNWTEHGVSIMRWILFVFSLLLFNLYIQRCSHSFDASSFPTFIRWNRKAREKNSLRLQSVYVTVYFLPN